MDSLLSTIGNGAAGLTAASIAYTFFSTATAGVTEPEAIAIQKIFRWHPILMSVGSVLFLSVGIHKAIDAMRSKNITDRNGSLQIHSVLNIVAAVCMSFGMWSIYKTKELLGYPHLATLHGKLGIAAVCLIFAGIIGGQLSFSMSPLYSLVPMETKATVKTLHRLSGRVTFALTMACTYTGLAYPHLSKGRLTTLWFVGIGIVIGAIIARTVLPQATEAPKGDKKVPIKNA